MFFLKFTRDVLSIAGAGLYAISDGLDLAIETLSPSPRGVQIHKFYEEAQDA